MSKQYLVLYFNFKVYSGFTKIFTHDYADVNISSQGYIAYFFNTFTMLSWLTNIESAVLLLKHSLISEFNCVLFLFSSIVSKF